MQKRILTSLQLSGIAFLVTTIGQVVTVPVLLSLWGAQVYGEWIVLTNLVRNISILNMGVQNYSQNLLRTHFVRGEIEEGTTVFQAALRLYIVLCAIGVLVVLFLASWPGLSGALNIEVLEVTHVRLIVISQGFLFIYGILGGLLMTVLVAIDHLPRRLIYSIIERLVFLISPIGVAVAGGFPPAAALVICLLIISVSLIEFKDVSCKTPYAIGLSAAHWRDSLLLIKPSVVFFAVSLSQLVLTSGMVLIISRVLDPKRVVVFTTTLMLTNMFRSFLNQALNAFWPEITGLAAIEGGKERIRILHRVALKTSLFIGFLLLVILCLFGNLIIKTWTHNEVDSDTMLNFLLAAYLLVHIPALVSRMFGLATNHQNQVFIVEIGVAVVSGISGFFLLRAVGLSGAALALIGGQFLGTMLILWLACEWTSDTRKSFLEDVFIKFLPIILAGISMLIGVWFLPIFLLQVFGVVLIVTFSSGMVWLTWFSQAERVQARRLLFPLMTRAFRVQKKLYTR